MCFCNVNGFDDLEISNEFDLAYVIVGEGEAPCSDKFHHPFHFI